MGCMSDREHASDRMGRSAMTETQGTRAIARPRLAGKRALVTGAAAGIGQAIALAFVAEGAQAIAADIRLAPLANMARANPPLRAMHLDVCDAAAITKARMEIGSIDVLVNCAGVVMPNTALDCSAEDFRRSLELNLVSVFQVTAAFLPGMIEAGAGSIINIASVVSSIRGAGNRFAYGTSKAAVIGLSKSVAVDFVQHGVRCNAICPGTIDTASLRDRIAASSEPAAAYASFIARQPMGRLGRPEEVAALAVYLASDESAFTTGGVYVIDGGWTA